MPFIKRYNLFGQRKIAYLLYWGHANNKVPTTANKNAPIRPYPNFTLFPYNSFDKVIVYQV
jgi:hypothetical protein